MAKLFEIPLSPMSQWMTIQLNQVEYRLRFFWVDAIEGGWLMDVYNLNNEPIALGRPLVGGADLLGQLAYLAIGGKITTFTDGDPDAPPTYTNLGKESHVLYEQPDA